jgi:hypothetical protein
VSGVPERNAWYKDLFRSNMAMVGYLIVLSGFGIAALSFGDGQVAGGIAVALVFIAIGLLIVRATRQWPFNR